jgi:Lar family restriction alleviation protein
MRMDNAKECPFCKSEWIYIEEVNTFASEKSKPKREYFAICDDCYARTGEYATRSEAIEAWNSRGGFGNVENK